MARTVPLLLSLVLVAACGEDDPKRTDADATGTSPETREDGSATEVGDDTTTGAETSDDTAITEVEDDATTVDTAGDTTSGDTVDDADTGCTPSVCAALAEERTAQALEGARANRPALDAFLTAMPKGGDLHHHLSGSIYAEEYLAWAIEEGGYCIDLRPSNYLSLSRSCGGAQTAAVPEPGDPLYDDVIAMWSMEDFDGAGGQSGHDHFFATFGKFGAISGRVHGRMLADVMRRAASENQVYIELMLVSNGVARDLGDAVWAQNHGGATLGEAAFATFLQELLAASGMSAAVREIIDDVVESEADAQAELGCDTASPEPACEVATRYQVYISRSGSLPGVFAQMVAAYEAGIDDPRVVGLNLVGPEDNVTSLRNYDIQMAMLGHLNTYYRVTDRSPVRLSLHAGELAAKYMPSGWDIGQIDHISRAIGRARADRIGHGLDLNHESDPYAILDRLRDEQILVEICLASNAIILEVSGADHPLGDYLDADVPVALGTDDQGVARSSLAAEHRRAVLDQGLDYFTLKRMARMSLEHAFLPGASLWFDLEIAVPVAPCMSSSGRVPGDGEPPDDCLDFLAANVRAGLQYELERRFVAFEAGQ